jgi:protein involved in polysaccharide export with SLBB domain
MSKRADANLHLFGYDQLGTAQAMNLSQAGAVQNDYVLGPGDQLAVSFRGQETSDYQVTVDRDGRVILPKLRPIAAAGRSFGDFRADLEEATHKAFLSTQVYVSVVQVRQVGVIVAGDVNAPGAKTLTGLSTPLDAILLAGGITKDGSLRGIKVMRGARALPYDLYAILTHQGRASHLYLADGDRIVVPPLGRTVAVTGWVRQPAIYEIAPGTGGITARSLMNLAGGVEVRGHYHLVLLRTEASGIREFVTIKNEGTIVHDGEILFVQPSNDEQVGGTTLGGNESLAGKYSVGKAGSLSALLKPAGAMGRNPYTLFGVISRRDPRNYQRTLMAFSPLAILNGSTDVALQTDDIVRVFSVEELQMLVTAVNYYGDQVKAAAQEAYNPSIVNPLDLQQQMNGNGQLNSQGLLSDSGNPISSPMQQNNLSQQNSYGSQFSNGTSYNSLGSSVAQGQTTSPILNNNLLANSYQGNRSSQAPNVQGQQQPGVMPGQVGAGYPGPYGAPQNGYGQSDNPLDQQKAPTQFSDVVDELKVAPTTLINFLIDHQIRVGGALGNPGLYFVGPSVSLQDVIAAAGGMGRWANRSNIEVVSTTVDNATGQSETTHQTVQVGSTQLANYLIKPRDEIHIQNVYTTLDAGVINLQGEVLSPGKYPITHGERLSQVLIRAGGLSNYAYPYGTVFLRKSVAAQEEATYQRTADEMQKQMVTGLSRGSASATGSLSAQAFTGLQSFIQELRTHPALGRVTVVADPSVLASHPDKDPLLEDGDVIFIPQRPSTVSVMGDVMQPGNFQFDAKSTPQDYIRLAGGFGTDAEEDQAFVIYPDGTAQALESSSWFGSDMSGIPPGSVIYVPRNLFPVDWLSLSTVLASILRDFAVSAASLSVISRN